MRKVHLINTIAIFAIVLFIPVLSFAGTQTGIIKQLVAHDNGNGIEKVDVELDGSFSNMDWCSTRQQWTFILDSEIAKAQFSMLLAAYAAGVAVTIDSDGSKVCVYGDRNRLRNVRLKAG